MANLLANGVYELRIYRSGCSAGLVAAHQQQARVNRPGYKRCRLHGDLSPGAPHGPKNGNFKTGDWTAEAIEERKWLRSLLQSFAKSASVK